MAFTYRKRVRIMPGVALNLSKRGVGVSAGPKGAKVSLGADGKVRSSVGTHGVRRTATHGHVGDLVGRSEPTSARRRRWPWIVGGIVGLLVLVSLLSGNADAAVRPASQTLTVAASDEASVTVRVAPAARCTIAVVYASGPSKAAGLEAKRGGTITWTWKVGSRTKPGLYPVTVDCGSSGRYAAKLRVHA